MSSNSIKIVFVGDILLHSRYNEIAREKGPSFVFEKVTPILKDSDLCFGNLECVLSSRGEPNPEKGCLRGDENYIDAMKEAGFDILSLANNHSFDFGLEAFEDMASKLEKTGVRIIGAGKDLVQSRNLVEIEINGIRIGFLAYSSRENGGFDYASGTGPGVAPLDEELVIEDIYRYKEGVDHLVVSLHWGIEYSPYPTPDQVALGRKIIEAGARMIIGHHPRILQGYEYYRDGLIIYSIGNLCHTDIVLKGPKRDYKADLRSCEREIAVVEIRLLKERIEDLKFVPIWLNDSGQPEICNGDKGTDILRKIKERSEALQVEKFEKYWESLLVKKRVWGPLREWWERDSLWAKIKNLRPSQFYTLWVLSADFVFAKFSKKSSKWLLFNPRNDKKARPYVGKEEDY